jgi:hypothetical protein
MRTLLLLGVAALFAAAGPAFAELPPQCLAVEHLAESSFPLPHVAAAIGRKKLDILVVGAGSSTLPGPGGETKAYPARMEAALAERFPGVAVKVTTDVKPARTAIEAVKGLPAAIASATPALVIWQAGTVDAMRSVDLDAFGASLDKGLQAAHAAGADAILMNGQYSPRTESIIALGTYAETMRWVALQREITLFDRFAIMKTWSELGTFDFMSPTKKLDIAEQVHDCIGRLLAYLIANAAKPIEAPHRDGR